jgi:hypothetical protein
MRLLNELIVEHVSRLFTVCAAIALIAAAPLDSAVIVGSSPSTLVYQIVVGSDGAASITTPAWGPKPFTIPADTVAFFFAALAASSNENWTSGPCTKEQPHYTVRVKWHGWVSGDVTCPAAEYDAIRLNHAVMVILVLAGPPAAIPCYELPRGDQPPNCRGS